MSAIQDANTNLKEATSIFTDLAEAIGNTQYDGGAFQGRMKSVAKTMAVVNKIGYATIPLYFRVKNQVETTLLAFGKISKSLKSQNKETGIFGKSLGALGKQYKKAKILSENITGAGPGGRSRDFKGRFTKKENRPSALNYLTFGASGAIGKGGKGFAKFITGQNRVQKIQDGLFNFAKKAEKRAKDLGSSIYSKLKRVPLKSIFTSLGTFLLFGLKVFMILTLGITALVILLKSKSIQTFLQKVLDTLIEVGFFVFDAVKGIIDGFTLIYKGLTGKQGIMKSVGMVLLGVGKILFGVFKILFGIAFIFLKGMFSALLSGLKVLGEYIVKGIKGKLGIAKTLGMVAISAAIPGMARGGISPGGLTLVGEEGPELVRLPSGAKVYSNPQSKRMATGATNNITVNVQGRIGASDTELRQIASKIGQMINKEVNRTTSSRGTLG